MWLTRCEKVKELEKKKGTTKSDKKKKGKRLEVEQNNGETFINIDKNSKNNKKLKNIEK